MSPLLANFAARSAFRVIQIDEIRSRLVVIATYGGAFGPRNRGEAAMVGVEQFSHMVAGIYAAALNSDHWPTAVQGISGALGAAGGGIIESFGTHRAPLCIQQSADAAASYRSYYNTIDYVLDAVEAGPVGLVHGGRELIEPLAGTEFDADWMQPHGLQDGLFIRLTAGPHPTTFVVTTPRGSQPFATPERVHTMGALVSHLQQALRARCHLIDSAQQNRELADTIDADDRGVVIVGAQGRVTRANPLAEKMIRLDDGLYVSGGVLHATRPATDAALAKSVAAALGTLDSAVRRGSSVLCPRPSGSRPFILRVLPLGIPGDAPACARALVLIIDPEREIRPDESVLRELFGLTAAETNVALQTLNGDGIQAVADRMCLSITTVRSHLQRIYAKTDTHRHADLVNLLLRVGR